MLKDIPYSTLKEDGRAYEWMLLRDQYGCTFTEPAEKAGLSAERVLELYYRTKVKQIRLYLNHIAVALGHEDASQVKEIYDRAYSGTRSIPMPVGIWRSGGEGFSLHTGRASPACRRGFSGACLPSGRR